MVFLGSVAPATLLKWVHYDSLAHDIDSAHRNLQRFVTSNYLRGTPRYFGITLILGSVLVCSHYSRGIPSFFDVTKILVVV
jgi:hypothetical protein